MGWSEPDDPFDPEHLAASERALQFDFGWFAHPIVIDGNYPQVMLDKVAYKSKVQNFSETRLTPFTEEEQRMIKGTLLQFEWTFFQYTPSWLYRVSYKVVCVLRFFKERRTFWALIFTRRPLFTRRTRGSLISVMMRIKMLVAVRNQAGWGKLCTYLSNKKDKFSSSLCIS